LTKQGIIDATAGRNICSFGELAIYFRDDKIVSAPS
jgi:hypothetical protein